MNERPIEDVLADARKLILGDKPQVKSRKTEAKPVVLVPWWERDGYTSFEEAMAAILPRIRAESASRPIATPAGVPDKYGEVHSFDIHDDAVGLLPKKCDWCDGSGAVGKSEPCSICGGSGLTKSPADTLDVSARAS